MTNNSIFNAKYMGNNQRKRKVNFGIPNSKRACNSSNKQNPKAEKNLKSLYFYQASRFPRDLHEIEDFDISELESDQLRRLLTFLRRRNVVAYAKLSNLFNGITHIPRPKKPEQKKNQSKNNKENPKNDNTKEPNLLSVGNKENPKNDNTKEPNLLSVGFIISYKNEPHVQTCNELYVQKKMYFSGRFYSPFRVRHTKDTKNHKKDDLNLLGKAIEANYHSEILHTTEQRKEFIRESLTKLGVEEIKPTKHFHSEVFAYNDVDFIKENITKIISNDVKENLQKTISKTQINQKGKIDKIFLCFDSFPNTMCTHACRDAIYKIVTEIASQLQSQNLDGKYSNIYGIVNSYRYFCPISTKNKKGVRHETVNMIELPPAYLEEIKDKNENNQVNPTYSDYLFQQIAEQEEHEKPNLRLMKTNNKEFERSLKHYIDILFNGKRMLDKNEFIAFNEEDLVLQIKYNKDNKRFQFKQQEESGRFGKATLKELREGRAEKINSILKNGRPHCKNCEDILQQ